MTFPVVSLYSRWISYSHNAVTDFNRIALTKNFKTVFFIFYFSQKSVSNFQGHSSSVYQASAIVLIHKIVTDKLLQLQLSFKVIWVKAVWPQRFVVMSATLSFGCSSRVKHWEVSSTRPTFSRKSQDRLISSNLWERSKCCESIVTYELLSLDILIGHNETSAERVASGNLPGPNWSKISKG